MDWGDVLTVLLVIVALWTFLPRHFRQSLRAGLEPAVIALADAVREGAHVAAKYVTALAYRVLIGRDITSIEHAPEPIESPVFEAKLNSETAETLRPVAETDTESFTFGATTALARLVAAGKVGLTDAVKIGADAKSGEKYQKRSREIKAAVDRLQTKYPHMTPEQAALRKELGIEKP
jgi:hypothetical protein